MFGFGDDNIVDKLIVDELINLEVAEVVLGCGQCRGRCGCHGRDPLGNLIRAEEQLIETEMIVEAIEDIW